MNPASIARNERGIALITVLLVAFAVSGIALAGAMWTLNAALITKNADRSAILNDVAVAGLEEGRSRLNANPALYPAAGYTTMVNDSLVTDATGADIPNLRRSLYVGPDGITSGQYGVYGTIISTVRDTFGNQVVRRLQINQESFAKYSYFTNTEGNIVFANNDQIRGPVHSNDEIEIVSSGATFFDQVTTAAPLIRGEQYGNFPGPPPKKSVPRIELPPPAAFAV
jgi:Tfp pilus assembly protein PilX